MRLGFADRSSFNRQWQMNGVVVLYQEDAKPNSGLRQ
jgi:hypothetical protein